MDKLSVLFVQFVSCILFRTRTGEQSEASPLAAKTSSCAPFVLRSTNHEHAQAVVLLELIRQKHHPSHRCHLGEKESSCQTATRTTHSAHNCSTAANLYLYMHRSDPKAIKEARHILTPRPPVCPECEAKPASTTTRFLRKTHNKKQP